MISAEVKLPRAPFQVVVIPFRISEDGSPLYCVMCRSDARYWQFIAGGGEDEETPERAARREAFEEGGLFECPLYRLQSMDTVAVIDFTERAHWPRDLYVVPQYTFATNVGSNDIILSHEHTEMRWANYEATYELLWQSNQTALWELNERLRQDDLPVPLS